MCAFHRLKNCNRIKGNHELWTPTVRPSLCFTVVDLVGVLSEWWTLWWIFMRLVSHTMKAQVVCWVLKQCELFKPFGSFWTGVFDSALLLPVRISAIRRHRHDKAQRLTKNKHRKCAQELCYEHNHRGVLSDSEDSRDQSGQVYWFLCEALRVWS